MKKQVLKSKNFFAKIALGLLGYALSTTQCLAQYMAIQPTVRGKLLDISDTIRKFRVIINKNDTLYTSWDQKYSFHYYKSSFREALDIEVSEVTENREIEYLTQMVAIKPDENYFEIKLEKKKK